MSGNPQPRRCIIPWLPLGLLLASAGCTGPSFERQWRAAAAQATTPEAMAGRWEGTWVSDVTGHHDVLRCLVTPQGGAANRYAARFHAQYKKVFRFRFQYTVPLQAESTGSTVQFRGSADLGWLAGGNYKYEGRVHGTNFDSSYDSRYDRGAFHLHRAASK